MATRFLASPDEVKVDTRVQFKAKHSPVSQELHRFQPCELSSELFMSRTSYTKHI